MLTLKNKLNNNLIQNSAFQMQAEMARQQKKQICSIEYLGPESPHQEMLLTSQNRNNTIQQESQDQLFDLYITPFNKKQQLQNLNLLHSDDRTLFHSRKKEEPSSQLYRQLDEDQDTVRLKAIIDKKNRTIDQVTQQLKNLSIQVKRLNKIVRKQESKNNKIQKNKNSHQEVQFLQKNNLELFEQLMKCRKEKEALEKALQTSKDKVNQLTQILKQAEKKNRELMKQNSSLLDKTKQFLTESQKEMKYFNKIRELFYQKTGIDDYSPIQSCTIRNSQIYSKQNYRNLNDGHTMAKQASSKVLLFDKSSTTHRKTSSSQKHKDPSSNFTNVKPKQRDRASGSLDIDRFSKSQRCTIKNSKVLEISRKSKKLDNLL